MFLINFTHFTRIFPPSKRIPHTFQNNSDARHMGFSECTNSLKKTFCYSGNRNKKANRHKYLSALSELVDNKLRIDAHIMIAYGKVVCVVAYLFLHFVRNKHAIRIATRRLDLTSLPCWLDSTRRRFR